MKRHQRLDPRELTRRRGKVERDALNAQRIAWNRLPDDGPDGPIASARIASADVAAYWQDRALRAERRALKRREYRVTFVILSSSRQDG